MNPGRILDLTLAALQSRSRVSPRGAAASSNPLSGCQEHLSARSMSLSALSPQQSESDARRGLCFLNVLGFFGHRVLSYRLFDSFAMIDGYLLASEAFAPMHTLTFDHSN